MNSADRIEEYSRLTSEKYGADLTLKDQDDDQGVVVSEPVGYQSVAGNSQKQEVSHGGAIDLESGLSLPTNNKRGGYFEMATLTLQAQQQSGPSSSTAAVINGKWPSAGNVAFEHIYMSYKPGAAPVLR